MTIGSSSFTVLGIRSDYVYESVKCECVCGREREREREKWEQIHLVDFVHQFSVIFDNSLCHFSQNEPNQNIPAHGKMNDENVLKARILIGNPNIAYEKHTGACTHCHLQICEGISASITNRKLWPNFGLLILALSYGFFSVETIEHFLLLVDFNTTHRAFYVARNTFNSMLNQIKTKGTGIRNETRKRMKTNWKIFSAKKIQRHFRPCGFIPFPFIQFRFSSSLFPFFVTFFCFVFFAICCLTLSSIQLMFLIYFSMPFSWFFFPPFFIRSSLGVSVNFYFGVILCPQQHCVDIDQPSPETIFHLIFSRFSIFASFAFDICFLFVRFFVVLFHFVVTYHGVFLFHSFILASLSFRFLSTITISLCFLYVHLLSFVLLSFL